MIQRSCENGMVVVGGDLILLLHPKHLVTLGGQKLNSAAVNKVAGGSEYVASVDFNLLFEMDSDSFDLGWCHCLRWLMNLR